MPASKSVSISDTPTTPVPTYSLTPSATSINEGNTLTTTVATTNVASGTTVYYALSGTGISAADFSSGALTGQVSVDANGSASFSHTLAKDVTTEGVESIRVQLFSDSSRSQLLASSKDIVLSDIIDNSIISHDSPPSYWSPSSAVVAKITALGISGILETLDSSSNRGYTDRYDREEAYVKNFAGNSYVIQPAIISTNNNWLPSTFTKPGTDILIYSTSDSSSTLKTSGFLEATDNYYTYDSGITIRDATLSKNGTLWLTGSKDKGGDSGGQINSLTLGIDLKLRKIVYYRSTDNEWNYQITEDSKGNIITCAGSESGPVFTKTNPTGDIVFKKNIVSGLYSRAYSVATDEYDNIIVAGTTQLPVNGVALSGGSSTDFFISKYGSSGNHIWTKMYPTNSFGSNDLEVNVIDLSIGENNSILASTKKTVFQLSGDTGNTLFRASVEGNAQETVWLKDAGLYVAVGNNHITLLNRDGAIKNRYQVDGFVSDIALINSSRFGVSMTKEAKRNGNWVIIDPESTKYIEFSLNPRYLITTSAAAVGEGETLITTISASNVAEGTTFFYTLSGAGLTANDFSSGAVDGQVVIGSNGSASFSHTLAKDVTTEGVESIRVQLFSDSSRSQLLASSTDVSIADTSTTPAPTYSLTPSATTINEGGTLITTIATTNVASGITLYYALSGTGITVADFSSGALTGEVSVGTNGSASFSHTLASDLTTEGSETLEIKLFSDSARTLQVGSPTTISVGDTSTTPRTNNTPTGSPTLSGTFKAGQVITIDRTPLQDADNFTGYTPVYNYSFEVSNDNGTTWTKLTSADATDNTTTYTLTTAEVGKQFRSVVSYLDGYGTNEVLPSTASVPISSSAPPVQSLTLTPPSKTSIRSGVSTTSAITYNVSTGETALTGIGASLYFDSTQLTVNTAGDPFKTGLLGSAITADTNNADGDSKTDKVLSLTYADFGGNFPGSGTVLPLTLANLNLVPTASYTGTTLHLKGSPATGFTATGADLTLGFNAAPTVTGTLTNKTINRGRAFTYTVPSGLFTDPDSTLSISAKTATGAALPSWLTFNTTTGTFTGTPTSGGTFNLAVAAADELGSVSAPLTLNVREVQSVSSSATDIRYQRNKDVTVPINYSTTDGSQTTGMSFKVHYNSSLFSFDPVTGVSNKATADLFQIGAVQSDTSNTDGDAGTDKFIPINVASFSGSFPSGATPIKLADLIFKAADKAIDPLTGLKDTKINFSETEAAQGYGFQGTGASLKPMSFSLDVDGDGKVTALGDGLMVIRHLFGSAFSGSALTDKAISPTSPFLGGVAYNTMNAEQKNQVASLVATNIQQGIDAGLLDVDKDGRTTALGDGLMVIRNLFGSAFSGTALIDKAISPSSPYLGGLTYATMNGDQKLAASGLVTANIDALRPTSI